MKKTTKYKYGGDIILNPKGSHPVTPKCSECKSKLSTEDGIWYCNKCKIHYFVFISYPPQTQDKPFKFEHDEEKFDLTLKYLEIAECINGLVDLRNYLTKESKTDKFLLEGYYTNRISYITQTIDKLGKIIRNIRNIFS